MNIAEVIDELEVLAPPSYQESYDNAGLITGSPSWKCSGILCCLDATEAIIAEAIQKGCNLVVAHHPIVFSGLKKITGKTYVERSIITAIKNEIAIYAIHTNLDNVLAGVNGRMADKLNLVNRKVLLPKQNNLLKLYVFTPETHAEQIREAIFKAGGGCISRYSECSFNIKGKGTFKPGEGTNPFLGEIGKRETSDEEKIEIIFPAYLREKIVYAMLDAHPYEEVAYDIVALTNFFDEVGSGVIGELPAMMAEKEFLQLLKDAFDLPVVRHTEATGKAIKNVALCGGSGSFMIKNALAVKADAYITADIKYHEFFDAEGRMLLADIGHYESEQFTIDLLFDVLQSKFPTFAVLKTKVNTNPVNYFL